MNKRTAISFLIVFISLIIFLVFDYINPSRQNKDLLSCISVVCPDHLLYGFGFCFSAYFCSMMFIGLLKKIIQVNEPYLTIFDYELISFFVFVFWMVGTLYFDYNWQFIDNLNDGSYIQYNNTIIGIILSIFYTLWFIKKPY